jgi:hypothetical protein
MKTYGGVDIQIRDFLTSVLIGGEWSASRPGRFPPDERAPGTHWIGGWVDPRAGLDDVKRRKFLTPPGLELRALGRPARSQSYRLRYPPPQMDTRFIPEGTTSSKSHHFHIKDFVTQIPSFCFLISPYFLDSKTTFHSKKC